MCKVETEGHVVFGLVGGVAEHHALVSCALLCAICTIYAAVDVGTLLVYCREYTATIAFEHVFALGIADAVDDFACYALQVDVCLCCDFACQDDLSCSDECFACHFRVGVEGKEFVEYGIADLVGHLIGMAFGD